MKQIDDYVRAEFGDSWYPLVRSEFEEEYMTKLSVLVRRDRANGAIYPATEDVFRAFRETSYDDVKVVIIGQDPYYTPKMAHGLCFSVPEETDPIPPSLSNIFKELEYDLGDEGFNMLHNPDLNRWAKQGVFLLNTVLTVKAGQPGSHAEYGWKVFTGAVLEHINACFRPIVFVTWGAYAKACLALINLQPQHLVISGAHPSPRSAHKGFFGTKPFSQINKFLEENYGTTINWAKNIAKSEENEETST